VDTSNTSHSNGDQAGSTAHITGKIGTPDEQTQQAIQNHEVAIHELTNSLEVMQHEVDAMERGLAFNPITPQQSQDSASGSQAHTEHTSEELVHIRMMKDLAKSLFAEANNQIELRNQAIRNIEAALRSTVEHQDDRYLIGVISDGFALSETKERYAELHKQYKTIKQQFDSARASYAEKHPSQEMSPLATQQSQPFSQ